MSLFFPPFPCNPLTVSPPSRTHARMSGLQVPVLLAHSHLSLRVTWALGSTSTPGCPAPLQTTPCDPLLVICWPLGLELGNGLPQICNSGLPELHTGSGMNRVSSTYLWTKLMMPRPRHTASPWQSQPRGRGSRCLCPSAFQQPGSLLVTQGCLPQHDWPSGERSPGHHPCPLLGGLCSHILTLVGLTGWTGSWGKSGKSRSGACPWWGADHKRANQPA